MSTIYLSKNNKDRIFNDLKKFFDLEKEYKKLIFLEKELFIEGPPGTGKSSLIFALASEFNMTFILD